MDPKFRDGALKIQELEGQKGQELSLAEDETLGPGETFDLGASLAREDDDLKPAMPSALEPQIGETLANAEPKLTDLSAFDTPSEKQGSPTPKQVIDREISSEVVKTLDKTKRRKSKSKISYI